MPPTLLVAGDLDALVTATAARIRDVAAAALAARGRFRVALAGGTTPRAFYPKFVDAVD
jgi:6-phosphogluconolactonase